MAADAFAKENAVVVEIPMNEITGSYEDGYVDDVPLRFPSNQYLQVGDDGAGTHWRSFIDFNTSDPEASFAFLNLGAILLDIPLSFSFFSELLIRSFNRCNTVVNFLSSSTIQSSPSIKILYCL